MLVDGSCSTEVWGKSSTVLAGKAVPGPLKSAPCQGEMTGGEGSIPLPITGIPLGDFPLEKSHNETLRYDSNQVRVIDAQKLQPSIMLSDPYFSIIKHRLYQVMQDTETKEEHNKNQLLVPKCCWEMLFQAAHSNLMPGHFELDKTLNHSIAHFYWPDIHGNVCKWCVACNK